MSISLVPEDQQELGLEIANGTWFTLLRTSPVGAILTEAPPTSDPFTATAQQAQACAGSLRDWEPPEGWYRTGGEAEGKATFIDFFENCGGFSTR